MDIKTTISNETRRRYAGYRHDVVEEAMKHGWGAVDFRLEWMKDDTWAPYSRATFFREEALEKIHKYASMNEVKSTEVMVTPKTIQAIVVYGPEKRICAELHTDDEKYSEVVAAFV